MSRAKDRGDFQESKDGVVFDASTRESIRRLGLLSGDCGAATAGAVKLVGSRRREVFRIEGERPRVYLKTAKVPQGIRRWAATSRGGPFAAEWKHLVHLRAHGIEAARPLAVFGGSKRQPAFLATEEVVGVDLSRRLARADRPAKVEAILAAVGSLLAALAEAAFHFEDFVGKHVIVAADGADPALSLIDVERGRIGRVAFEQRAGMAADLLATIPDRAVTEEAIAGFLDGAFGRDAGKAAALLVRLLPSRRRRRRLRRFLAEDPECYLVDRYLDDGVSVFRGPLPFSSVVTALDAIGSKASIDIEGTRCHILSGRTGELRRLLDAADQGFRFGFRAGLPRGLLVESGGRAAHLLVEAAEPEGRAVDFFAAAGGSFAGSVLGRLHEAGILGTGIGIEGDLPVVFDWTRVVRPDPVTDRSLSSDLRRVLRRIRKENRPQFVESYLAARQRRVEESLVARDLSSRK